MMRTQPLWLREKLFWKVYRHRLQQWQALFRWAPLEFAPSAGLTLVETDISHQQIALCGFYELAVSRQIQRLAQAGGLMIDVGANYGYYAALWAAARSDNQVYAFEAVPTNLSALQTNLDQNGFSQQVQTYGVAVGQVSGKQRFALGPQPQTGWGGFSSEQGEGTIEVEVTSLADFFQRVEPTGHTTVLKVDVEGADTWVLQGAEPLLRSRTIEHIFFEENIPRLLALGIVPGTAQQLLQACGYRLKELVPGQWYAQLSH